METPDTLTPTTHIAGEPIALKRKGRAVVAVMGAAHPGGVYAYPTWIEGLGAVRDHSGFWIRWAGGVNVDPNTLAYLKGKPQPYPDSPRFNPATLAALKAIG